MYSKRVMKVGLIGAGLQGRRRARALKNCDDSIVAIADLQLDRAASLATEVGGKPTEDSRELIGCSDIETVMICTPPHLHERLCVEALESGKHVLCEKPLARTLEEAKTIVSVASKNKRRLKCGFNLRHHPGIRQARGWIDEGMIGDVLFIRCRYGMGGRPGYDKEWRAFPAISGGGQLMDQGMHAIDLARWFMGDFVEATGFLQTCFWDVAPLEDNAFCLFRNEKGGVASIHVSWTEWKNQFSLEIFGRDGYVIVSGLGGSYGVESVALGKRAFLKPFEERTIEFRGTDRSWEEEWQEFRSAIWDNREPLANGIDGMEAVRLAYAVYESSAKGHTIGIALNHETYVNIPPHTREKMAGHYGPVTEVGGI